MASCGIWLWIPPITILAQDPIVERRQQVRDLSAEEKLELQQKKERFEALSPDEQQRMRELHQKLQAHEQSENLQQVLQRYDRWLGTLTSGQRAKLLAMPVPERIEQIREMKRRSEESLFGLITSSRLSPTDARLVFDWLDKLAAEKEASLREQLDPRSRGWIDQIREGPRRRSMILRILLREQGAEALPQPTSEEVEALVAQLSAEAQERFRSQKDPAQQERLVQLWIQAALLSRLLPPPVSDEELQRFFVEDLSADERESLERLPRDVMSHELRKRYFHYQLRRRLPGNGFDRPPGPGGDRERGRSSGRGFRPRPPDGPPGGPPDGPPENWFDGPNDRGDRRGPEDWRDRGGPDEGRGRRPRPPFEENREDRPPPDDAPREDAPRENAPASGTDG